MKVPYKYLTETEYQPLQMVIFAAMEYQLKKSLGQHFLINESICKKIAAALQELPLSHLLEVGPGGGALTKYLLQIPNIDLKAVEIDTEKVAYLEKTYPNLKNNIIHTDMLEMDAPFTTHFTVIGNFPYNISSQILFKILEWKTQVPFVIGMFQKEVAQRLAAKPNSKAYGILSVLIQAFYKVEYLFDVEPTAFKPPPKVMSGVIQLTKNEHVVPMHSEKYFFLLVKTAFNQRRKMLRNAVKNLFEATVLQDEIFSKRAEQLGVDDFAMLTFKMKLN
ncbi:16S rRNA (adenine(1518)-N(6)/adenine(1519)-N(6))-dimethyltransferase RsmA [Hydrotalea flava]|uniref:16S rRNA (adenine(1518)-N(6)/adenine(1519)-N(6))- dimethyltransferase RsmA n=1 Tax=Hydrotalea flava TaxID=714549 RepID=UPI000AAE03FE|nr:16S rRNA (adenine(1518)-N(6)/adenine(1519)-N(6))-dimethyltransferase RsmA [Hydrotalea flava]